MKYSHLQTSNLLKDKFIAPTRELKTAAAITVSTHLRDRIVSLSSTVKAETVGLEFKISTTARKGIKCYTYKVEYALFNLIA